MNTNTILKSKCIRKSDSKVIAEPCFVAKNLWERTIGLMGHPYLEQKSGLWIESCNSIHTFFMKFSIDVVYIDRSGKILEIQRNIKPWRIAKPVFKASAVLEMMVGEAKDLSEGEELCLS